MSIEIWMMFASAYLLITLSPGPNVLLVLKNSIQYGWQSAFITVLGNLSCQLLIVCLVAIGVGGVLAQLPSWFLVMKCGGGAYLIYLGIKSLRSKPKNSMTLPNGADKTEHKGLLSLYLQAFLVSASNPKTLIFLSAFLPQFLDVSHSHFEQFSIMYLTIAVIVTLVHLSYAMIVSRLGKTLRTHHFERKLAKVTGGLFITMGSGVLLSSRP